MKRGMREVIKILMIFFVTYLYIGNPLEKHYNLMNVLLGWIVLLLVVYICLLRYNKKYRGVGYMVSTALFAFAYLVIPM